MQNKFVILLLCVATFVAIESKDIYCPRKGVLFKRKCYLKLDEFPLKSIAEMEDKCKGYGGNILNTTFKNAEIIGKAVLFDFTFFMSDNVQQKRCEGFCWIERGISYASNRNISNIYVRYNRTGNCWCNHGNDFWYGSSICEISPYTGCTNRNRGKVERDVFLKHDDYFQFDQPSVWGTEFYQCKWKVESLANLSFGHKHAFVVTLDLGFPFNSSNQTTGDHVFGSLYIKEYRSKEVLMQIDEIKNFVNIEKASNSEILFWDLKHSQSYTLLLDSNRIVVELIVRNQPKFTVNFNVKVSTISKATLPTMYNVQNHDIPQDFTWNAASEFCVKQSKKLCKTSDICFNNNIYYLTGALDEMHPPLQYVPVSDIYNKWLLRNGFSHCDSFHRRLPKIPPVWGQAQGMCPNEDCSFKGYIYCCDNVTNDYPASKMVLIDLLSHEFISNLFIYKFYYRYRYENPNYINPPRPDISPGYMPNWNIGGRIQGDLSRFKLKDRYSKMSPNPVYVCYHKFVSVVDPGEEHINMYALLLRCPKNWIEVYVFYTSLVPRGNLRPIYVGVLRHRGIIASRVSKDPFCCGYDDPELSFIMYGFYKDEWETVLPDENRCSEKMVYTELSGSIPATAYRGEHDCVWTIVAPPGHSIVMNVSGDAAARYNEYSMAIYDPINMKSYGRMKSFTYFRRNRILISKSIAINVRIFAKNLIPGVSSEPFILTYDIINSTRPQVVKMRNHLRDWHLAREQCRQREMDLCRISELCSITNSNPPFVPVIHEERQWLQLKDKNFCLQWIYWKSKPKNDSKVDLYCCKYPDELKSHLPQAPSGPNTLPIYILARNVSKGKYFYSFYDSTDFFGFLTGRINSGSWRDVVKWNVTAPVEYGVPSVFYLSSIYVQGSYDQVLWICSKNNATDPRYHLSKVSCDTIGLEFTHFDEYYYSLSGGKKLYVNYDEDGSSMVSTRNKCCSYDTDSFEIFVREYTLAE